MFVFRRGLLAAAIALSVAGSVRAEEIVVFAAASLKNAFDEISQGYPAESGDTLVVSLAGSSALARQIQQGAPADVYISANVNWMDTLEKEGLIDPETRVDLLGNSLVMVAHGQGAAPVELNSALDLPALLGGGKLAMALVDSVPAGVYGKAALTSLGLWDATAPHVAQSDNVRAALALVATGEAPYGIVYATDAVAEDGVTVVGTFPADSHPPIIYPAARIAESDNPRAGAFLEWLRGPTARAAFERQGFNVMGN